MISLFTAKKAFQSILRQATVNYLKCCTFLCIFRKMFVKCWVFKVIFLFFTSITKFLWWIRGFFSFVTVLNKLCIRTLWKSLRASSKSTHSRRMCLIVRVVWVDDVLDAHLVVKVPLRVWLIDLNKYICLCNSVPLKRQHRADNVKILGL